MSQITLQNDFLVVTFNHNGRLDSLQLRDGTPLCGSGFAFDLMVEGQLFLSKNRNITATYKKDNGACFVWEKAGLRVTQHVELESGARLRQSAEIEVTSGPPRLLTAIHWRVGALQLGEKADCLLQAPAQITPPDCPLDEAVQLPLDLTVLEPLPSYPQGWLQPAPDETSGLVCIETVRAAKSLASGSTRKPRRPFQLWTATGAT
jgi:hypothetical protein